MNSHPRISLLSLLFAILCVGAVAPAHALGSFGQSSFGTIPSNGLTADYKRGAKFTLGGTEPVDVTSLYALLDGRGGPTTGSQSIRLAIYRDASGVPGSKVAESVTVPIEAQSGSRWRRFPVGDVPLQPGDYWLVILSGATGGIVRDYSDGQTTNWYGNADTFSDGGSSSFGTGSWGTGTVSIYAEYGSLTERGYAGRTTVGSTPSSGLSADFKRASKVTLTEQGRVESLTAFLDGLGAATGSQRFRLALYRDNNGVPGAKVTESFEQTINAGQAPQWVTVHTPLVQLDPGSYWVAIHSGGTAGIIRDYGGDGANNWYGNSDAYADGASPPFGGGSTGTGTMSVGFGYTPGVYEIRKHGRTTVGTIASSGLTADYARAQPNPAYIEMPTGGPITGYYAYLDGNGGASGTQQMRIAMYLDDCYHGEPARYWSESEVVSVPAGQPAGWVYFPVKIPNEVGAVCSWTLALESGGTQGVVRDYADGTDTWYGIQDTFSDGPTYDYPTNPSSTPGVGIGTGRLSMYFEYAVPAGSP